MLTGKARGSQRRRGDHLRRVGVLSRNLKFILRKVQRCCQAVILSIAAQSAGRPVGSPVDPVEEGEDGQVLVFEE